ncbi:MAG: flavodoxin [Phycisphaerae bacterium]|nr:flavodoxin [Phycisphaerae bacterium]
MKSLVVYYSRTGITRTVSQYVAEALCADVEELIDTKNRKGPLGFVLAGKDAALKKLVPIEPPKTNPAEYDLVILASPVWANTMSSAIRAYLTKHGKEIRAAALLSTTHTSGIAESQRDMRALLGCEVIAAAGFRQKSVKRGEHIAALDAFIGNCKASSPAEQA